MSWRLLKETGRLTNAPVFVVGVYSGADKLGEGFGSSLKMAEYRVSLCSLLLKVNRFTDVLQAAEDALLRVYLTRQPPHLVQLPSVTFEPERAYTPTPLGDAEIHYGAADRTGLVRRGARSLETIEEEV